MASLPPSSFKCATCSKSFSKAVYLKKHAIVHTGDKRFKCPFCSKTCLRNGDLKKHLVTHTGERRYQCDVCAKTFTQGCHLKEHQLVHSTDKPVSCNICWKCFKDNQGLRRHILMHTGQNPFQCYACCKIFARSTDLRTHMLVVHCGEQVYCCGECSRTYAVLDALKEHMKIHTAQVSTSAGDDEEKQTSKCVSVLGVYDSASNSSESHDDDDSWITAKSPVAKSKSLVMESKSLVTDSKLSSTESKPHLMESRLLMTELKSPIMDPKSPETESKSPVTEDLDIFMCSECLKCFSTDAVLQKHLLVHVEDDMTEDNDGLSEEMKQDGRRGPCPSMWTGKRLFKCDECSECFAEDCMLRQHMWTHVKEKDLETNKKKPNPKTTNTKPKKRRKRKKTNATDLVPEVNKVVIKKHMVIHPDEDQLEYVDMEAEGDAGATSVDHEKCSRVDSGTELDQGDEESSVNSLKYYDCDVISGNFEQHLLSEVRRPGVEEMPQINDDLKRVRRRKKLTPRRHVDIGEVDSDGESDIFQTSKVDVELDICQASSVNRELDIFQSNDIKRESDTCETNDVKRESHIYQTSDVMISSENKPFTCDRCSTSFTKINSLKQHIKTDCNKNGWHNDTDSDHFKHCGIEEHNIKNEKCKEHRTGDASDMDFPEGHDSTAQVGSDDSSLCPCSLSSEPVSQQNKLTVLNQIKLEISPQDDSQDLLQNKTVLKNKSSIVQSTIVKNISSVLQNKSTMLQKKSPVLKQNNLHMNQMDKETTSKPLFQSSGDLTEYSTVRCQRKLFACETCAQTFTEGESLRMHRHDAHKKPFTCNVCAKTFAFNSTLKTHMVAHTDHELYRCETCSKTFTRKGNLKRHIFLHCN